MSTYLWDILDPSELSQMVDEGYVRVQTHPVYPYNIACYTKQAMFERVWNNTTLNCRGLIWRQDNGRVLARPFKKFFNYGEPNAPEFAHDDWVTVYDKVDGSLGIAYDTPEGPAIATKGSFASEQAIHATKLLRAKYGMYDSEEWVTDLFEIIYPENRIVLDYGDKDDLIYLGSVYIDSGEDYWNGVYIDMVCGIPKNHFMLAGEWGQVKEQIALNRPNAEGVVVLREETGDRIKLKQEDYLELHKVMTGLNERQLWEWLAEGKSFNSILEDLPEELHDWAGPIMGKILDEREVMVHAIGSAYQYHVSHASDRKDFALRIKGYPSLDKGVMFCMLDGHFDRAEQLIWNSLKPRGEKK